MSAIVDKNRRLLSKNYWKWTWWYSNVSDKQRRSEVGLQGTTLPCTNVQWFPRNCFIGQGSYDQVSKDRNIVNIFSELLSYVANGTSILNPA